MLAASNGQIVYPRSVSGGDFAMKSAVRAVVAGVAAHPRAVTCIIAGILMGILGGCRSPDPGPVQPSLTLASTADDATAGTVDSATSSTNVPAEEANAVAVDAAWVREHPELTRLFTVARACLRTEGFLRDLDDGATIHSYELYSPGLAQEDLERRFRESARELGYIVNESVNGPGFWDEAKGISAYISEARLTVLLKISDSPAKAAGTLAATSGFATWPMLAALPDATWKHIRIAKSTGGASLDAELEVGAAGRGHIERWAQAHQLARSPDGWVQKWQPAPASRAGIDFEFNADRKLVVLESIGQELSAGACQEHPTRKTKVTPTPSVPSPTEDELMKQMMGN